MIQWPLLEGKGRLIGNIPDHHSCQYGSLTARDTVVRPTSTARLSPPSLHPPSFTNSSLPPRGTELTRVRSPYQLCALCATAAHDTMGLNVMYMVEVEV